MSMLYSAASATQVQGAHNSLPGTVEVPSHHGGYRLKVVPHPDRLGRRVPHGYRRLHQV